MKIGEQIRLIRGMKEEKTISDWIVKNTSEKLIILDNSKYLTCLNLADFIDQKYTKIYINRTGKLEQIKAFGLCDLREI